VKRELQNRKRYCSCVCEKKNEGDFERRFTDRGWKKRQSHEIKYIQTVCTARFGPHQLANESIKGINNHVRGGAGR